MLTFNKFSGINNVVPQHRLKNDALRMAMNVDIGLDGEVKRRKGYVQASATCSESLWQADGFIMAIDNGDLVAIHPSTTTVVYPSLGPDRVWYVNFPDGRTAFSNGLICGVTDGTNTTTWGVPLPDNAGLVTDIAGDLDTTAYYQYQITLVRDSDGLEGPPAYQSTPAQMTSGGWRIHSLPTVAGHSINVYLSAANGVETWYVGNTASNTIDITSRSTADLITTPNRTDFLYPAPVGKPLGFFRGRTLVAVDNVLYASRPFQYEHFLTLKDFKQFSAPITLIQAVDDGLYIGTEEELAFLAGTEFDKLAYRRVVEGATVLGSGVPVRGELIRTGTDVGAGSAVMCIADGIIAAGFNGGNVERLTEGRYRTGVTEVAATFRMLDDIPQYIAIPL